MRKWLILGAVVIVAAVVTVYVSTQPGPSSTGDFELVNEGTAIRKVGDNAPFLRVSDLPDTVPTLFPHAAEQHFQNRKFHFISVSPNQRLIEFASGEGDQWLGMLDSRLRYMKFIVFGVQTTFYPGVWSPDSKFMTYAFYGPDRRLSVYITDPKGPDDPSPQNINVWFKSFYQGEKFQAGEWQWGPDTSFSFTITDAGGKELQKVVLPLRFDPNKLPDEMRQEMERMRTK
jgi:hypothetical protein